MGPALPAEIHKKPNASKIDLSRLPTMNGFEFNDLAKMGVLDNVERKVTSTTRLTF